MNAIVRKHYPISNLPADLRKGLPAHGWVDVEIRPEPSRTPAADRLRNVIGTGMNVHGDELAVLEHIRDLREDR